MSEAIAELYKFCLLEKMWIIRLLPILGTGMLWKEPKYFAFLAGVQHYCEDSKEFGINNLIVFGCVGYWSELWRDQMQWWKTCNGWCKDTSRFYNLKILCQSWNVKRKMYVIHSFLSKCIVFDDASMSFIFLQNTYILCAL
jgi:hypothetical protein